MGQCMQMLLLRFCVLYSLCLATLLYSCLNDDAPLCASTSILSLSQSSGCAAAAPLLGVEQSVA